MKRPKESIEGNVTLQPSSVGLLWSISFIINSELLMKMKTWKPHTGMKELGRQDI
jgi:hypothetical protein